MCRSRGCATAVARAEDGEELPGIACDVQQPFGVVDGVGVVACTERLEVGKQRGVVHGHGGEYAPSGLGHASAATTENNYE